MQRLNSLSLVLILLLMSACSATQDPSPPLKQTIEPVAANSSYPKPKPDITHQTPIASFNFEQPFAMKVIALGCGIGCPIYKLSIHPDFSADYEGVAFVKVKGNQSFLLTQDTRQALRNMLQSKEFAMVQTPRNSCRYQKTDSVRYQVALAQDDKSFQTVVEEGCHLGALKPLESVLDDIVGRWKGRFKKAVK